MDYPYLVLLDPSQGHSEALVIIRGYLSENGFTQDVQSKWVNDLRKAGWTGAIYHLWWESSSDCFWNVARLNFRWNQVKSRAKKVGQYYLNDLIASIPETSITLIGYSLGARVIYYALNNHLHWPKIINHVILLGGAIRRNKDWGIRASKVAGKLVNVYNSNDYVLKTLFKIGEFYLKSPCGLKPIKDQHSQIINIDATTIFSSSSHSEFQYLRIVPDLLKSIFCTNY